MIYAIDNMGVKIKASPGELAFCPNCKAKVIAKCGELNIWHWAHESVFACDDWQYEPISEWHLKWQNYFSENCREVFMTKFDETHIADILTTSGLVVEIQNSSLSTTDISERESFYENMIWIVNSIEFKHNLSFKSYPTPPWEPVYKEYVRMQLPTSKYAYQIKVPVDDTSNAIVTALKQANYKILDEDEDIWYKLKNRDGRHETLDTEVVNAFGGYLIDQLFAIEFEANKVYQTNFKWTHMRKTWRTAKNPFYFDFNNGFLFQIITLHDSGYGFGKIVHKRTLLKQLGGKFTSSFNLNK